MTFITCQNERMAAPDMRVQLATESDKCYNRMCDTEHVVVAVVNYDLQACSHMTFEQVFVARQKGKKFPKVEAYMAQYDTDFIEWRRINALRQSLPPS